MKLSGRGAILAFCSLFLTIAFLELILTTLSAAFPAVRRLLSPPWKSIDWIIPDDRLIYRPSPEHPEHDSKGFRNPSVPTRADIVALGDSQTYGTGVKREEAWPRQLEMMANRTVYSFAFGGYGPVHSLILLDEAIALNPRIIVEAFYAGNDLYDSFNLVYNRAKFQKLKNVDLKVQRSVQLLEQSDPIAKNVYHMFNLKTQQAYDNTNAASHISQPRRFLSRHSMVYGLMRRAKYEFQAFVSRLLSNQQTEWEKAVRYAQDRPGCCQIFNNGRFRTVLTPQYRSSILDLDDPRIAEGHRISLEAIRTMKDLVTDRGGRFLVLLIPTKEFVFKEQVLNPVESYRVLAEMEDQFWRITKAFLKRHEVDYVDALPALRAQLSAGYQPYPVSRDGHPNELGHRSIAALLLERVREEP